MKTKRKPRRTVVATARTAVGRLSLVHVGTQFHMAVNDARLESVRTAGAAKRMFLEATEALGGKPIAKGKKAHA